jgi:hypothetical protein
MKIINSILLIFSLAITTNCGFKVMNQLENSNFIFSEINTTGQKRINYKIKNYFMLNTNKDSKIKLLINLDSTKSKIIKEKNIRNEITKYTIVLKSEIEFNKTDEVKKKKFNKSVTGDFMVNEKYSITVNNENNLIDDLVKKLSEDILDEISLKLNDL